MCKRDFTENGLNKGVLISRDLGGTGKKAYLCADGRSLLASAKTIMTIHNLKFQGIYNISAIRYWSGLPDYVFNKGALKTGYEDANMLKGGLKDTVEPYNMYSNTGNGFTFDHYDAGLLLDAINRAKTLFFTNRWCWDEMVQRDMDKSLSWDSSAEQYKNLYLELT